MNRLRTPETARHAAIAASTVLGLQSIRVFIVMLYGLRESRGISMALGLTLVVFSAPIAAPVMERLGGSRAARRVATGGFAITAIAVQLVHPIPWWLAAAASAFALITWTLLLAGERSPSSRGGAEFALAFVAGMALDTGLHAALGTWDAIWRPDWFAAVSTIVLAVVLVAAAPRIASSGRIANGGREASFARVYPVAALGPFLVIQFLFLHNVAFVNAVTGMSPALGAATVLAGEILACAVMVWGVARAGRVASGLGAVGLIVLMWVVPDTGGPPAAVVMILASGLAGAALSLALSRGGEADRAGSWRTGLALMMGSMAFAALIFAYQIHAIAPLPVSNRMLAPLAALLLGGAAVGSRRGRDRPAIVLDRRLVAVPVAMVMVVVPVLFIAMPVPSPTPSAPSSLRILSWNVHSAVDANGQLVPEIAAEQIVVLRPDVVVLQEVSRGWPIGGTLDLATWLSSRLDMPFVWGPAADDTFGNLVLSRVPIVASETVALPFGAGPQHRSMLKVVLRTPTGDVTIVGTHLESAAGTDTRTQQIRALLDRIGDTARTVVAGDMNMQPDDGADIAMFLDAGFASAQDGSDQPHASTARDPAVPGDRPDWIFVSSDLVVSDFRILPAESSDHLPLVVDVAI